MSKKRKYKIVILIILMMSLGLFIILSLYNKPLLDVNKTDPDIVLLAGELINDYRSDELSANEKYVDKLVQVTGQIFEISTENGNSIITIKGVDGDSSVICHISPEHNRKVLSLKRGDQVTIKGICTGYLLDVMMVRCVLINN